MFLAINLTIFQFHVNNDDFQFDLNTNQVSIEMTLEFVLQLYLTERFQPIVFQNVVANDTTDEFLKMMDFSCLWVIFVLLNIFLSIIGATVLCI